MAISEHVINGNNIGAKPIKAIAALTATLMSTTAITTAPALADSFKAFPGNMCQPSSPSDLPKLVRGDNYIYNISTSSYAYVACPIVRGYPGDDEGTSNGPYSTIFVLKYNTQTLTCRLSGYYSSGDSASSQSVSTNNTGNASISTARVAQRNIYGIFCSLPPSSGILSYYSFFK